MRERRVLASKGWNSMSGPADFHVRERIQKQIPGGSLQNRNLVGSVIAVLSRLVEHGEVHALVLESGQGAWQWTGEPTNESSPPQPKGTSSQ